MTYKRDKNGIAGGTEVDRPYDHKVVMDKVAGEEEGFKRGVNLGFTPTNNPAKYTPQHTTEGARICAREGCGNEFKPIFRSTVCNSCKIAGVNKPRGHAARRALVDQMIVHSWLEICPEIFFKKATNPKKMGYDGTIWSADGKGELLRYSITRNGRRSQITFKRHPRTDKIYISVKCKRKYAVARKLITGPIGHKEPSINKPQNMPRIKLWAKPGECECDVCKMGALLTVAL
ncbi:MAG: hypothetical protein GY712_04885 [Oceanicoccus sp.]|uniref:hypothetical protein n=1 Tax=Oceanicoccus sp. TaxID=2691044 RepID=UPI00260D89C6|nr:hypothetical protein [Oceanicoccus sp.]MCP3907334.1 hypothetical protein [Oceanicoccus sp.]